MARKMKDLTFREEQYNNRYSPHIRPINEFVDALSNYPNSWVPYVAPLYGGANAKLLSLLRDPGPKTQIEAGSGFICLENDDPTAELMCNMFEQHNISPSDAMLWNIYPWYINQKPSAKQVNVGVDVLAGLLKILPKLEVVMTHGGDAKKDGKNSLKNILK